MRKIVSSINLYLLLSEIGVEIGAIQRTRTGGILLQVKSKEEVEISSGSCKTLWAR